jgi:hypothetical protein
LTENGAAKILLGKKFRMKKNLKKFGVTIRSKKIRKLLSEY